MRRSTAGRTGVRARRIRGRRRRLGVGGCGRSRRLDAASEVEPARVAVDDERQRRIDGVADDGDEVLGGVVGRLAESDEQRHARLAERPDERVERGPKAIERVELDERRKVLHDDAVRLLRRHERGEVAVGRVEPVDPRAARSAAPGVRSRRRRPVP